MASISPEGGEGHLGFSKDPSQPCTPQRLVSLMVKVLFSLLI